MRISLVRDHTTGQNLPFYPPAPTPFFYFIHHQSNDNNSNNINNINDDYDDDITNDNVTPGNSYLLL